MAATAGDYLVMRNNADTSTIPNAGGGNLDLTYDTTVASNGTSVTYSGGTFTFASGYYLITYGERFDGSTARNEVQGRLNVGGTNTDVGASHGYIRVDGAANECTPNGACILYIPSDSTSVKVRFYRTDSVSSTVTRQTGWGGISILALDSTWNYARYSLASGVTPDAFSDVVWDTNDEQDTGFSRSSGQITITNAGRYLLCYSTLMNDSGSGNRALHIVRATLNDTEVKGTKTTAYTRNANGCDDAATSCAMVIDVSANDVLAIECDIILGTTTNISMPAGSNMQIVQLPAAAECIIASATTGELNTSTVTEFAWDTTDFIDTDSFTMGAGTDSYFDVDTDDDYLFFWGGFTDSGGVGSGQRSYLTGRISVNDTIQTWGLAGCYEREGGTVFYGGYSSGILCAGLSAGDDISMETLALANTPACPATNAAIAGINLTTLFSAAPPATSVQDIIGQGIIPFAR